MTYLPHMSSYKRDETMNQFRHFLLTLRYGEWAAGLQWPPKFMAGHIYYDWDWYYLHLGVVWINVH